MNTIINMLLPAILANIIPLAVVCIIFYLMVQAIKSAHSSKTIRTTVKYKKKDIVTARELKFYRELKQIADRNRLTLFTKVRLADILGPDAQERTSEYNTGFNRIKSKHIDFVLCDSVQLKPLIAIELDDSTHQRSDRQKRDAFVDEAMKSANMPIIHTYDTNKLEEKIKAVLTPTSTK